MINQTPYEVNNSLLQNLEEFQFVDIDNIDLIHEDNYDEWDSLGNFREITIEPSKAMMGLFKTITSVEGRKFTKRIKKINLNLSVNSIKLVTYILKNLIKNESKINENNLSKLSEYINTSKIDETKMDPKFKLSIESEPFYLTPPQKIDEEMIISENKQCEQIVDFNELCDLVFKDIEESDQKIFRKLVKMENFILQDSSQKNVETSIYNVFESLL